MLTGKKLPSPIKAVLFDLDDTLLDSLKARTGALGQVFHEFGITDLPPEKFLFNLNGSPFVNALRELGRARNITDDLFTKYRRAYWFDRREKLELYPGVKDMLVVLKNLGLKLGIVTSKMHKFMFEGRRIGCIGELETLGIYDLFDVIIGLEDVTKPKPHPQCIELALEKIGVKPGHTLVVGDTLADIQAARSAGCISCCAVWGIAPGEGDTAKSLADFIAFRPEDIINFLEKNKKILS